ncbi:CYTH and CHAD domain-containing protein [Rhodocyclus tenuis]|uniref:Inorganic triphosphatase YgiF n=1 Tax=Rhodocyclus tenuis TaxID=1066 RepID=A0A840FXL6_RHOTE|nr:CYTH and CHAD domain-containing protein [Rhodocyclus tenuis]MBB4246857.1 inorganic triphosphatase YgiF [Rhodocyclus tenuis]
MPIETEIKLALPARAAAQLLRHPLLAATPPRKQRLANTYYDTADLALLKARIAVRHRRHGWQHLLTVKGAAPSVGGLAQRNEWEAPSAPGEFDFTHVDVPELRRQLEAWRDSLRPAFSTDFTRLAWIIEPRPGARVEVAFDRGHIAANGRREAICELELELLAGEVADLFTLACTLQETLPLHPASASKAERGYRLFVGPNEAKARAAKARAIALDAGMSTTAGFAAVALSCLEHLQGNERGVRDSGEPEFVHQARVAIRRLRSALRVWRPLLPAEPFAAFDARWRALAVALGEARNQEVFATETLPPLLAAFPDCAAAARLQKHASARRKASRRAARAALAAPEYSRLLLEFTAATLALSGSNTPTLKDFARDCLTKSARRVARQAAAAQGADAAARHRLRIALKRLRYAVEFFAPLFAGSKVDRYLRSAADLQELLGHMNDLAVAAELIAQAPRAAQSQLARGWLAGRDELMRREIDAAIDAFVRQPPPWKKR